jgi:hypothetical protein
MIRGECLICSFGFEGLVSQFGFTAPKDFNPMVGICHLANMALKSVAIKPVYQTESTAVGLRDRAPNVRTLAPG